MPKFSLLFFYYLACLILYVLASPLLFFLSFKPKYKNSIKKRFFAPDMSILDMQYYFHACSLGEVKSLEVVLKSLKGQILLSVITQTGYTQAQKLFSQNQNIKIIFLPFEIFLPFYAYKVRKKGSKLRFLVVVESEYWLNLAVFGKILKAKTMQLNAIMNEKSYKKYNRARFLYRPLFLSFNYVLTQNDFSTDKFHSFGQINAKTFINIKLLNEPKLAMKYNFTGSPLILAASTHKDEEEGILQGFCDFHSFCSTARLLIAPRHPERFTSVRALVDLYASKYNLKSALFSEIAPSDNANIDILLIDKIGILNDLYANVPSPIVILGGAFRDGVGGHNPLEPAFFGCPIITGAHYYNQSALFNHILHYYVIELKDLENSLKNFKQLQKSQILKTEGKLAKLLKILEQKA